ncbi:hypothetical protein SAMN05421823_102261 [Catalinimonas alkaloidigena]|uniref:Uncharacterized protein n=1 Tax=Catalinimonas alkaloidigena TaxID=1075417 RepID=A0A1G9ADA3_9BACT|nr:hypothetical protein [Catalinimonas alkaloidigena]SDK25382.1 hypothetical protein SAMN05421823_102261 [Catalinimonas alkaloidigena]
MLPWTKDVLLKEIKLYLHTFRFSFFSGFYTISHYEEARRERCILDVHHLPLELIRGEDFHTVFADYDMQLGYFGILASQAQAHLLRSCYGWLQAYCTHSSAINLRKFQRKVPHPYHEMLAYLDVLVGCMSPWQQHREISWPHTDRTEVHWRGQSLRKGMQGAAVALGTGEALVLAQDILRFCQQELS